MVWQQDLITNESRIGMRSAPGLINLSFASSINFARTERKRSLAERTCPPRFAVRWIFRSVGVIRHGAPCVLEGLPQAIPRLLPGAPSGQLRHNVWEPGLGVREQKRLPLWVKTGCYRNLPSSGLGLPHIRAM